MGLKDTVIPLTTGNKPQDYLHVRAWHKQGGSHGYYIERKMNEAACDNAPLNATWKDDSGKWHTIDDCQNKEFKARVEADVEFYKKGN